MMPATETEKHRPGWRAILLGLFVLFQAIYLPLSNLIQLVPREMPAQTGELDIRIQREGTATSIQPLQAAINGLGTAVDRYGELSGQAQWWALFAQVGTQSVFPVVECLVVNDGRLVRDRFMPSHTPATIGPYFRWPDARGRLNAYAFVVAIAYWDCNPQSLLERGDEWRDAVRTRVRRQQRSLQAWFRTSSNIFREWHPDLPAPQDMTLYVQIIPSPLPGQSERAPTMLVPLARWRSDRPPDPGFLPVEAYDPVAKDFVRLPVTEDGQ
jgi:hypothetical protein